MKWNDRRLELLAKKKTDKLTSRETEELRLMERCVQYNQVEETKTKEVLNKLLDKLRGLGYGL